MCVERPATYQKERDWVVLTAADFSLGTRWLQHQMGLVSAASASDLELSDLELTDLEKLTQPLGY